MALTGELTRRKKASSGCWTSTEPASIPNEWSDDLAGRADVQGIAHEEWRRAYEASRRLPLDSYSEVFDPTTIPAEAGVIGSLSDDLADVYGDVAAGLRAYELGDRAGAVWEWSFGLHSHWGAHATSAIRALHWWLSDNYPNRLSRNEGTG